MALASMRQQPPRSRELFVFANRACAQFAGFGGPKMAHRQATNAVAWWPDLGIHRLYGHRFHRVTITEEYRRRAYERGLEEADAYFDQLRSRLVEPAIWIDL